MVFQLADNQPTQKNNEKKQCGKKILGQMQRWLSPFWTPKPRRAGPVPAPAAGFQSGSIAK
jgi:hypothetical protein